MSSKLLIYTTLIVVILQSGSGERAANKTTVREQLFTDYDKDVRPNQGVGPLLVEVDLYVESFANIAEANMEYAIFGYFRHYWTDERLANKSQETIQLKGSTVEHAWTPDTYISNARQSNLRLKDSEAQSAFFVYPNGSIFYSKGVKIVASCEMKLANFPMDTQECLLTLGSYGHSDKDVSYKWKKKTITVEKKNIAQFDMNDVHLHSDFMSYSSGNYTQLVVTFCFKRRIGYYINQVYVPDTLVVAISWIVFWLDPDDMGGRVGLGITTLLTIMFLLGSVNSALPRVSYAKAIDWYLIVSFLFVFLVLLECILVYILRPRGKKSKDQPGVKSADVEGDMSEKSRMKEDEYEVKLLKKRGLLNLSNSEPVIARDSNGAIPFLPQNKNDIEMIDSSQEHAQDPIKIKNKGHRTSIAKAIDYVSRFLFPFAFIFFNVFYWYHFLNAV